MLDKFNNWDLIMMGYYSYLDFKNLKNIKKKFNRVDVRSGYSRENELPVSYIYKYYDKPNGVDWRDYRIDTLIANLHDDLKRDVSALYVTQSETRNIKTQDSLLYLNFPLKHIRDDVKNTMYGEFDYDVIDEFLKRLDASDCDYAEWLKLHEEFNKRFPKIKEEEYVWCKRAELDLHCSFYKYGQLNIPVIDRPRSIWMGSSHTFFHACYLKWDYLPVFIKIPTTENSKLLSSWYSLVPPNNFSHGHYNDSKIFYMYYFDLKNEKIYYKKYPKEKYKPMKDAYNRIPQDLYKEFTELEL